jgi:hypothetical protein
MAESFLDYGGGQSLENVLLKKLQAGGAQPAGGEVPTIPGVAAQPTLDTGTAGVGVPAPSFMDKIMKGLVDYGVPLAQMGTALMRPVGPGAKGQETVGSQMGSAITGALESQKMNEALRKMIAGQLSGKGGGSFNEGQPVGLTGAEVAGLTPDQISGLYGIGLKVRESELKRPMDAISTISDAYLKIMSGEAKPAEMEAHLATAQKAYQEIAAAPAKNMIELMTKIQAMEKAGAEIDEIKAKTGAIPTETAKKEAETKKTAAETKKLGLEMNPEYTALKKRIETEYGTKLEEIRRGDEVTLVNPITGKPVLSYSIKPTPETGTKTAAAELPLKKFAMQRIAPLVVRQLETEMAALPGGKQKVDLQNLISSLRGYTGEIDPGVLLAKSSPQLQEKFNKLMDIYVKTPGLSETEFGGIVQSILGTSAATPPPAAPGEKPVTEKFKKTAAAPIAVFTAQLKGKPSGTYESDSWQVKWDGTTVTSSTPKAPTKAAPAYNFGTF